MTVNLDLLDEESATQAIEKVAEIVEDYDSIMPANPTKSAAAGGRKRHSYFY